MTKPVRNQKTILSKHSIPAKPSNAAAATADLGGDNGSLGESMTHASIDSMVALDTGLRITAWNDATADWSGLGYAEVAGKTLFEVFPHARQIAGFEEALQRALKGMKSFFPALDSVYLPGHFEVHIVPLKDSGGSITGVLQILHDVAHRLKAENELKSLNRMLRRQFAALQLANDELAAFAKIAAHDLKEPLRKIYTFVELIMVHEAGKLSSSGRSNFRRIQTSVQRMGLLTDDIVNFCELSRREERAPLDVAALLAEETGRFRREIEQTGAVIKAGPFPPFSGFPAAMIQVLRQLLSNALKFQAEDRSPVITISAELTDKVKGDEAQAQPGQQYYHLTVADNGIGFDPQFDRLIFEMFQRLHPAGTFRGSGMGLAIARKAVQLHGGYITAESVPGEGSTFHCYLPVTPEPLQP